MGTTGWITRMYGDYPVVVLLPYGQRWADGNSTTIAQQGAVMCNMDASNEGWYASTAVPDTCYQALPTIHYRHAALP